MKRMTRLCLFRCACVLIAACVLASCASTVGNKRIADQKIMSQIKEGQTTKAEVKKLLGEPNQEYGNVWSYTYGRTTNSGSGLNMALSTVMIPVSPGKDKTTDVNVSISFTKDDIVSKVTSDKSMLQLH